MATTILHISDLHFGDKNAALNSREVHLVLCNLLKKAGADASLVLSGDISFKGQTEGYLEAKSTLQAVINESGISSNRIIVCPGNHDIVKSTKDLSPFQAFDVWSTSLRNDKRCTFSTNSCRSVSFPEVDFLILNSAHHCDIEYGLVNLTELDKILTEASSTSNQEKPRVAVLHHHLIPFSGSGDKSTTRNAYQVLTRLIRHGFSLILHGHQHALLEIRIGDCLMRLCGVGSFQYITPGFINGASIYRVDEHKQVTAEHYAISKDAPDLLRKFTNF